MIPFVIAISCLSLVFAVYLARWVLQRDMGTQKMQQISNAIKEGAEAFMSRQNRTIISLSVALAVLIFLLYAFVRTPSPADPVPPVAMAFWTTLSFVLGAACSVFSGYVVMWLSIRSNIRTASAVRTSLNAGLQIAMRGGAVSGLFVVAMSLLGVGGLYYLLESLGHDPQKIPFTIVGYGFGASFVALFAQLGGGIYTKAADVGADLVGKVEAGIPEDDPRNPAVIADLVGDNVGDCAGRGGEHRRDDPRRSSPRRVRHQRDPLPARDHGARVDLLDRRRHGRAHEGRRRPDEGVEPRLLRDRGAGHRRVLLRRAHAAQSSRRPRCVVALLRLRVDRHRDVDRLRLHHAVLHRVSLSSRARHRGREPDGTGDEHHRRHRRRHGID